MKDDAAPYKILANKDQLEKAGILLDGWQVHTHSNGTQLPNRVVREFHTLESATAIYSNLHALHLIALKNWLS